MRYAISINDEIVLLKPQHLDAMKHQRNIIKEGMWTEAELNAVGIYQITDGTFDPFALRNVGFALDLVDNKAVETIITEAILVKDIKARELQNLSAEMGGVMQSRPSVDTGLGFFVFGSRIDKDNFKEIWEGMIDDNLSTDIAYDIDDNPQELSASNMKKVYKAIVKNARSVCAAGRVKKAAIKTVDDDTGTVQEVWDAIQ
jgi:hypothetical protein